jgi:UDP-glucuronate 4-epimerase
LPEPGPVIVTGAAGFIGSHLAHALCAQGRRVVGVDNFDPFYDRSIKERNIASLPADQFELVEADIRDADSMTALATLTKPSVIIHLAALAGVRPSIREPSRFVSVNVDGLTTMLDAARAADCDQFLFASSSSVYGNASTVPFTEDDPADAPISPYAATKRAGEMICHTYAHLFKLRVTCLRFFTVFGPRQRPDLAIHLFMRKLRANESIPMFGDGGMSRDYTFIDDIVAGVLAALTHNARQSPGFCRAFNLGGAHPIKLCDLIALIGEVAGIEPVIEQLPQQPGDVERTLADLTRSSSELGFAPAFDLRAGLHQQWQWLIESSPPTALRRGS